MSLATQTHTLRSSLKYEPRELEFGTSGRRGKVVDLTQLEVYINALAELEFLQSLVPSEGGILRGEEFFFARDLRLSSDCFVPEQEGRGEIAQAIVAAIRDAGMQAINLGTIPTPALTCYALARGKGSMMITGSHIPFDRNGYKTNSSKGELRKEQEAPINEQVQRERQRLYSQDQNESLFDDRGMFRAGHQELPAEDSEARVAWIQRFTSFFKDKSLRGKRILVDQQSAVGRDLLVEILERLHDRGWTQRYLRSHRHREHRCSAAGHDPGTGFGCYSQTWTDPCHRVDGRRQRPAADSRRGYDNRQSALFRRRSGGHGGS